jgi:hypothetical protein
MNVSSVFRDSGLRNGSILAFIGYLIFLDPDLSAIEFAGGKLAKRVWKPYEPGQKQAKRVTLVKFDSKWKLDQPLGRIRRSLLHQRERWLRQTRMVQGQAE